MDYKRNRGGQSSPTKCIEGTIKKLTANKKRGGGGLVITISQTLVGRSVHRDTTKIIKIRERN